MSTGTAKLAITLFALFTCAPASPAMYRWVDESGATVYSQSPPASGDAVKLKKRPALSADDAAATREQVKKRREQAFDEGEARKEAEAARAQQAKKAGDERVRAANCATARANLEMLQNLGPRMIRMPDGRVMRLSEEQVQTQTEKARMQIEDNCRF